MDTAPNSNSNSNSNIDVERGTTEQVQVSSSSTSDANESLKLAIAMALFRSKLLQKQPKPKSTPNALKWKRKAKERKQLILRLKHDLKQAEDGIQFDLFPQSAACKCYFFQNLGKVSPKFFGDDSTFNDVLRRRFLRQVRFNERRKRRNSDDETQKHCFPDSNNEDAVELLSASVDFLVDLCESSCQMEDPKFVNLSHQAVDFILASVKNPLFMGKNVEHVEGIVNGLVMRLIRRMCATVEGDEVQHADADAQVRVQHLIRKLGSEPNVGQRAILSVSQRISVLAESFLFMDPFDDAFPNMHRSMYILIQLIEFLVSGHLLAWLSADRFDSGIFEEWVASLLRAQKTVKLLESRNGLYILYLDRVIGEVAKRVGQVSSLLKLNPDVLDNLFQ